MELLLVLQGAALGLLPNKQATQTQTDYYIQVLLHYVGRFFVYVVLLIMDKSYTWILFLYNKGLENS